MEKKLAWREFLVQCGPDAEEAGISLMECGASGTELLPGGALRCWVEEEKIECFLQQVKELQYPVVEQSKIEGTPWLEQCEELWAPVTIAGIPIVPVRDAQVPVPSDSLGIIPGTGFGTGHHATTSMAGEFLISPQVMASQPKSILDFGTGSGILAMMCTRLFSSRIIAIDNDPLAIRNAEDNIALNKLSAKIDLRCSSIEQVSDTFDLIVANIYADVLIPLQALLAKSLNSSGILVLSGIPVATLPKVEETYVSAGFRLHGRTEKEGWGALLLQK